VPDPVLGQRVIAAVHLHGDTDPFVPSDIMVAISGQLAGYKLPERLFPMAALPRNATGKLDRHQLTAMMVEWLAVGKTSAIAQRSRIIQ